MERLTSMAASVRESLNEAYLEVRRDDFREACSHLSHGLRAPLRLMFGADEREAGGAFKVYAVFSLPGKDRFAVVALPVREEEGSFPSITPEVPAAHWYEREIRDMLGLEPEGHPDPRPLVLHDSFPAGSHPLRRDWSLSEDEKRRWGEGRPNGNAYRFFQVEGEGVFEIPVGPVHAGIIEPGHFRFSAVGESIYFLEPRLFYTHKGTEKHFEALGFAGGVRLAERVSGTSSFAHSAAYCMAVERAAGIRVSDKAMAVRTLLLELERIYNHIGDIGNVCAGTGFAVGYAMGASIKERLMGLNERLTGSRYLRGVNTLGGVAVDVFEKRDDILSTLDGVIREYKKFMGLLLGAVSHVERLENAGVLSRDIALRLGATGITARASGIGDDLRNAHPHLLYDRLAFEPYTSARGDVLARVLVRAGEAECSASMVHTLLEEPYSGGLSAPAGEVPPGASALGYAESPRGSVFYWVKADGEGRPLRVKLRSPSFCNWPVVPFAVAGNIVPDFPLCNKSFNLSYSGCDM
ncbi:MAG: NADH-quinone oxidoreductase subunit C [Thermodesulfovibrionales bacterium]